MDWNPLNFTCKYPPHPSAINYKPKNFELMKIYARKLSRRFIFVRVDFYEYNDDVRLGELTFTPMNGFLECTKENDIELSKYFQLHSFKWKLKRFFY